MNLPINWLKQFVNINRGAEEIAEKLTLSGSEVEKISRMDDALSKIVVGQIKKIEPHPDADSLCVAMVDVGGKAHLKIVCGAKNIKEKDKVPCVLAGGSVIGIGKVQKRKIRGVSSQGMICSERELGIGDDNSGIFILPSGAKIRADAVKYLQLDEPVLEMDITPNRPDCFSIRGLSREVAALYGKKMKQKDAQVKESGTPASSAISVRVEDKKLCPKYCARVIQGVKSGQSPLWMQNRLRQVGIRPINNIVDATNYVMMELGHPLHAFDANLLSGGEIVVRRARSGEKIVALDGNKYALNSNTLVIADRKKPVAIAGIMGGEETGVSEGTQNIILEGAVFDPVCVRRSSRLLGLRSESSSRFEKGVDFEVVEEAIDLASAMICELAGGTVLRGIIKQEANPKQTLPIKFPSSVIGRIIGINVSCAKIKSILSSLGFEVAGKDNITVRVPSWRLHDVKSAEDLAEEVGRIMDYNTIPKTLPLAELLSPRVEPLHGLRRNLKHYFKGIGYSEILTYSFYNESSIALSGIGKSLHIKLTNPVNDEYPYLRASLLPWMLNKLSQNSSVLTRERFQLFEIGKIFSLKSSKALSGAPCEHWQASIGLIDTQATDEQLYRQLRGAIEAFADKDLCVEKQGKEYAVSSGRNTVATIEVYPKGSISGLRFRSSAAVLLINLEELIKISRTRSVIYQPIQYYPSVERDLGVVVPNMVQYTEIKAAISKFNPLIKKVELFDVYHGLGKLSSFAFRLTFFSTDRTLESQEVDGIIDKLRASLEKKYKVSFR